MFKKNQTMIIALALMIAVAGYLNFAGENVAEEEMLSMEENTIVDEDGVAPDAGHHARAQVAVQVEKRRVLIHFHDAAEKYGLVLSAQVVFVTADDILDCRVVFKERLKSLFGDYRKHGSMLFVPVEKNTSGEHDIAHGAETYSDHVLIAYRGGIPCHINLPLCLPLFYVPKVEASTGDMRGSAPHPGREIISLHPYH